MNMEIEILNELENYIKKIKNESITLQKLLSLYDKTIADVIHEAEFKKLNACDGFEIYKKLHVLTNERREIKNKSGILCSISDNLKQINFQKIQNRLNNGMYIGQKLNKLK